MIKGTPWADTIDRTTIKTQYMNSKVMGVKSFLRDELQRSNNQVINGNTAKKTKWWQAEKIIMNKQIENQSIEDIKKKEIAEKAAFTKQLKHYYNKNTLAIFEMIEKGEAQYLWLKDRVEVNKELRTQLWLPSNISSSTFKPENPDDLEDPARALLAMEQLDEVQDIDDRGDWSSDD